MRDFFKKNKRKVISTLLIFAAVFLIFVPAFFKTIPIFDPNSSKIVLIENMSQILAAVSVIAGAIIAVWQYYIFSKSEIIKIETEKVKNAIDLSEYYKNEVLQLYSIVILVYKHSGIFDFVQKEKNKMKNFDLEELHEIFTPQELKELLSKYGSKQFVEKVAETNEVFNLQLNGCYSTETISDDGEKCISINVEIDKALNNFFANYVTTLLNNIEQFAMYFTHNVADESVVYQSLYPTYIEMCRTLYYDISKCSKPGSAKLYRNLQSLYSIWVEKSNKTKEQIKQQEVNNGTIPQNIK